MKEENYKIGDKFRDGWGEIWKIFAVRGGNIIIWNETLGEGLWNNGKGLTRLSNNIK